MRPLILMQCLLFAGIALAQQPTPEELAKKPPNERLLKGDDAKKAVELQKRAEELQAKDDYPAAIKALEEVLALREKIQGKEHYETIDARNLLDVARTVGKLDENDRRNWRVTTGKGREADQLESQAKFAQELPIRKEILAVRLKVLGEDHPDTASNYDSVAVSLAAKGQYVEAGPLYQKALAIRRKVLGEDHPATAASYHNVASNLAIQGRAAEAEPLYRKALEIFRKVVGEEHPDTATSYSGVAYNLQAQGKYVEAGPLFQKALEIKRKVLGEESPAIAVGYHNVASNLTTQGRAAEAEPVFRKALAIYQKAFGDDHPRTASIYNGVAYNLQAQGKYVEAGPLFQKALEIRRKVFGEEHPDTAVSYNNVAYNLDAQGKTAEAEPLYRKALAIWQKLLGVEHPHTATGYNNLAANLDAQGKYVEAEPLFQTALDIRRKALGEEHPDTARSYNGVAVNLSAQGRHVEAGPLLQKALKFRRKVLGEEHPDTAVSYNNVAYNLDAQGKTAEAEPLLRKALDIYRKVFGEEHQGTAQLYNNVSLNLAAQEKPSEAGRVLSATIPVYEASRNQSASGLERGNLTAVNPRLLLASLQAKSSPDLGWGQLELCLARGLFDQQAGGGTARLTAEEQRTEGAARERLATLQPRIFHLVTRTERSAEESRELERLLNERREHSATVAKLAVAESERAVASPERIRAALPADAALVYWVDVTDESRRFQEHWGCVVRRDGESRWERLPGTGDQGKWTKDDGNLSGQLRDALTQKKPAAVIEVLAKKLHDQRIAPLTKHLIGVKTLYLVGVNDMAGIPVELLAPEYTVGYVPSGSFLAKLGKKADRPATLLAVGDPIYELDKVKVTALPPGGLLVQTVTPGGAADKARLKDGDVLLKYGDTAVNTLDELQAAVQKAAGATDATVTYWRVNDRNEGAERTVPLPTGPLGVSLARDPAPKALATRRQADELLVATRGGTFADLPGTRYEVNRIAALFDQPTVLLDGKASEAAVDGLRSAGDLGKYRYLHFAAHGQGNSVRAFDSALILSQDQPGQEFAPAEKRPWLNNQVSAREVLDHWKLDADLVTLSACETAVGKQGGGDGLLGFAQAFLTAGSRSVCLSLWEVDDTATALLMGRFYENLLGKREGLTAPLGKAAALREAKEWLRGLTGEQATALTAALTKGVARGGRKEKTGKLLRENPEPSKPGDKPYAHPQYWAAFVLIGDPN